MRSMTAFALCRRTVGGFVIAWELRSLNHRTLEVQFRLPDAVRGLEGRLRNLVPQHLARGKLSCVLSAEHGAETPPMTLNRPLLLQLLAMLEQVRRDAPEAQASNPVDLLRWPGMLKAAEEDLAGATEQAAADLFEQALRQLVEARAKEGAQIKAALQQRLDAAGQLLDKVRRLTTDLPAQMRARLQARLRTLQARVSAERLEQEIVLLAQKADVAEELDRLAMHLQDAQRHIEGPGPHGQRLIFLAQELLREANTLGAKAESPQTAQLTVDLRVAIEQIREQAHNIE